jgi:hypothetical protein
VLFREQASPERIGALMTGGRDPIADRAE